MEAIAAHLVSSAVVHLATLLVVGWRRAASAALQFEDIDYTIFTEAAAFVSAGESPYLRATYRYTPLLAYLLLPTVWWRDFGKILFSVCTLLCGWLVYRLLLFRGETPRAAATATGLLWLHNPLVVIVSARGNADSIVSLATVGMLYLLVREKMLLCAALFGFCVHFRIYPVIYAPALLLFVHRRGGSALRFAAVSALAFAGLLVLFWRLYGPVFVHETYLHHLTRIDMRHNLAPFFYAYYAAPYLPHILSLLCTGATGALVALIAWKNAADPVFAVFLQTFVFVLFNRVFTAQYIVWYCVFLPFVGMDKSLFVLAAAILLWNTTAYGLEFAGKNLFAEVWACSLLVFCANIYIALSYMRQAKRSRLK